VAKYLEKEAARGRLHLAPAFIIFCIRSVRPAWRPFWAVLFYAGIALTLVNLTVYYFFLRKLNQ
jgi:hypothetical protein